MLALTGMTTQRMLLFAGIASSLTYVAANVVAGLAWKDYSFASQTISELSAIDAPSRQVWLSFGAIYNLFLVAFAIGVWQAAGHRQGLRATAIALVAICALSAVWPPMHMRGEVQTLADTLHVVFAALVSVVIFVAIATGMRSFDRRFRNYSIATIGALLVVGGLTFALSPGVGTNEPTPWLGVVERINLGLYLLWVVVLSLRLLHEGQDGRHHGSELRYRPNYGA
jgi:hypothetical protein